MCFNNRSNFFINILMSDHFQVGYFRNRNMLFLVKRKNFALILYLFLIYLISVYKLLFQNIALANYVVWSWVPKTNTTNNWNKTINNKQTAPLGGTEIFCSDVGIIAYIWETCMQVRKQQLELDMEQQTGSK